MVIHLFYSVYGAVMDKNITLDYVAKLLRASNLLSDEQFELLVAEGEKQRDRLHKQLAGRAFGPAEQKP